MHRIEQLITLKLQTCQSQTFILLVLLLLFHNSFRQHMYHFVFTKRKKIAKKRKKTRCVNAFLTLKFLYFLYCYCFCMQRTISLYIICFHEGIAKRSVVCQCFSDSRIFILLLLLLHNSLPRIATIARCFRAQWTIYGNRYRRRIDHFCFHKDIAEKLAACQWFFGPIHRGMY